MNSKESHSFQDSLPLKALPNLMRGISQFKRTGELHYLTDNEKGSLLFSEGKIVSIKCEQESFSQFFLTRLYVLGIIPGNAYDLLKSNLLSLDKLRTTLVKHNFINSITWELRYENAIQEYLFRLLEFQNGNIHFVLKRELVRKENDLSLEYGQNESEASPGHLLLDFVEMLSSKEELTLEGNSLSRINELSSTQMFSEVENNIIAYANIGASIDQVIKEVGESRLEVMNILKRLKDSGILVFENRSIAVDRDDSEEIFDQVEITCKESFSSFIVDSEDLSYVQKANIILMEAAGIEWVLKRVMPILLVCISYYFYVSFQGFFHEVERLLPV